MTTGGPDGRLIDGRFELLDRLGGGGMGLVWRARDTALHREVALKEVRPPDPAMLAADPAAAHELRERVLREARALARLQHSNVVVIHHIVDSAELPHPWLVMELVSGGSLADRIAERPLDAPEAARIGRGVLAALRAAHAAGIQHRDVKPGNILLRADGSPVLTDFGIAAMTETPSLTSTGALIGSPEYIAPERIRGTEGNPASDLWSLAMTLYVAVEGHHPLRRATTYATLAAVLDEPLPPPVRAGTLGAVLAAALARDPSARPDAEQLDRLLAAAEAGTPYSATHLDTPRPGPAPWAGGSAPATPWPGTGAAAGSGTPWPGTAGAAPGTGTPWPGTSGAPGAPGTPWPATVGGPAGGGTPWGTAGAGTPWPGTGGPADQVPGGGTPWPATAGGANPWAGSTGPADRIPGDAPAGPTGADAPVVKPGRPGRRVLVPIAVVLVAATAATAWTLRPHFLGTNAKGQQSGTTSGSTVIGGAGTAGLGATGGPGTGSGTPKGNAPAAAKGDLVSSDGLRAVVDALRNGSPGGTTVKELTVHSEFANAVVPVAAGPKQYDTYEYRDGRLSREPHGTGTDIGTVKTLDVASVDWSMLPAAMQKAQNTLNVPNPTTHYLIVDSDGLFPGLTIRIYLADEYGGGYLALDKNWKVVKAFPRD